MSMMTSVPLDVTKEKEDERRYKPEARLYTIIKVARDGDLQEQIGRDIFFDLVDHDKVRSFRIKKQTLFRDFKEEIAKEFGVPAQFQRFWMWAKRQNHTYRPNRPLTPHEEAQSVGQLREVSNKTHGAELKLFLEVELGLDLRPIAPPDKTKGDILLFFKLYDPEKGELRYVGRLFVKSSSEPMEILAKLNQLAGFLPDEEIELYEEIKFEPCIMCEHLDKRTSFRKSQLEDGDIVCFQKASFENEAECLHPDVPSFLEYVHNRQEVDDEVTDDEEADAYSQALGSVGPPRRGVSSCGSSPKASDEALSVSPPREQSPPRASPLSVSRVVDNEVAVVEPTPVVERALVPTPLCPPSAPFAAPSPTKTSSSLGTAASIALPEDDDSDLALFESIGITFPISKPSQSTIFNAPASSATTVKTPTSKRAEILKALSSVVCYLHDVKDLKDVDSNAEPPLAVFKALETLKTQGSDLLLLPKEKITLISKLSTDLALTVSRYMVRHDLFQSIATDEKDIEARTKAFEDADATIKTMSTDYWEARQQRDAKRKEFVAAEDEVSRLQAELARAQERASEFQSQFTKAEQRRLTSFRACADFKDTVYECARIKRERVEQSLERKKALYAKEKDDLDMAHGFLLDVISCLDTNYQL